MTADPALVLGWLVLAHLVADFVFQTEHMATAKFGNGVDAWRALGAHVAVVGAFTVPVIAAYGLPGLTFAALTIGTHLLIDRAKIVLTRAAEPRPAGGAEPTAEAIAAGPPMDRAWTATPGALFAFDQVVHLVVLFIGWIVFLARTPPLDWFTSVIDGIRGGNDPTLFHHGVLTVVVIAALVIINVRAASLFVATLVRAPVTPRDVGRASEARVGAVIGVLERLLICALVLGGAVGTIGFVIAAKTIARFKQLEDRQFAEYYLMGTLASVTIAVSSSLLAQAVLANA
ncbi:MAG: DUF3307 domain-containing protein [Candidatus Limnocylindrales bacterium]